MNPVYNPPNIITEACEQYSVPQKTYTELLPLLPSSGFNVYTSESTSFPHSTSSPHVYESRNGRISYEKSFGTASFCESVAPRNVAHQNQEESTRLISTYINSEKNKSGQSDENKSRDQEIRRLHEKLDNVVSKQDFRTLNNKLDKLLRKRVNSMPPKPPLFPLKSVQQVIDFNNISQEVYENAIEYLHFVGGFTLHDAVKYCMKEAMTDDTIRHYSAWGERGNLPLFDTKLIKVIYGKLLWLVKYITCILLNCYTNKLRFNCL
ncbi:uncharacterized protein LOC115242241 [Formica exsecta]|uniref:uncharacterized protein LOC115242241 n=1 Tax=Formica exsecta TaxID=72781 RepID=UPI0011429B94|nr:uncharacterized protein LOC115242241 [Formica exsecta]